MAEEAKGSPRRSTPVRSDYLRQLRTERGWTQEDLARRSGYSIRLISKAETGRPIDGETVRTLAETLSTAEKRVYPEDLTVSPESVVLLYAQRYRELGRNFIMSISEYFAEEFECYVAGDPEQIPFAGTWRGVTGYLEFWRIFFECFAWQGASAFHPSIVSDGQTCVAMGQETVRAVQTGEMSASWVTLRFSFRRGRIVRVEHYFDTADTEKALG